MATAAPATVVPVGTSAAVQLYAPGSGYARDLIIDNGGPGALTVASTSAGAAAGLIIPAGQQLVLQGPVEAVWGIASGSAATAYVSLGTVVSVI